MAKDGQDLLHLAMKNIRVLGYKIDFSPPERMGFGKHVRKIIKGADEEFALIQSRSSQEDDERYLVGIMISDLEKVDTFFLWLQGEEYSFKIPAKKLVDLFTTVKTTGDASYSGKHNDQWRVDVYAKKKILTPQVPKDRQRFASKKRLPIACYAIKNPNISD